MAAVRDSSNAEFEEIFNAPTTLKSNVWKHFGFYKKYGKLNKTQVICKECRASKPYNGSTTNMIIHLKRKHDIHTNRAATPVSSSNSTGAEANPSTSKTGGGQLTCSTLSLMVPTLRLMSAFAWQVVQHCNVVHYGKVEELVQLVTEVVPHLLSDTEKVHLLLGLKATEEFPEADLLALVWEFISRLDTLLPLPDIKRTAELLSAAPSLLEECGQLEFEPDQLKTLLDHHTQQRNAKECSWVQSQSTIPPTASSPQSKPQQNCSNIQRCRRSGRKLSPHCRTEEDKDRQSDHSLEEEEGAEGKQSDEEWLPVNDHIIEEEEGAEGKQSDEEWVPENCSKTKRKKNINKDLKEGQPIISSSVRRSARPVYTCSLCSMEFTTKRALTRSHMRTHTLPYRCDICDERYPFKAQLTNHWHSMHTGVDLYTGPGLHACPQRSSSHSQEDTVLQTPIRQEHTIKLDNLPHSDTTAMKSNKRPIHRCSYCGLEFKRFCLLKCHVGLHTMPFHCDHCDKRYASKQGLILHRRLHTGERPFTCSHCGRGFKQMAHLNGHIRTHTGERYTCHICGKKSIQQPTHIRHMLMHKREKRLEKHKGEKRLEKHKGEKRLEKHKGEKRLEKNYLCTECGRLFKQMGQLSDHMRTHTGEHRYTCHICGKKSIQHHTHVRHMRMHKGEKNYLCTECGKAFLTKGDLGKHTRCHTGERPHACKLCGKRFVSSSELTKHMRIHTGEKPYSCTHCPKAFLSASKLKTHMFVHSEKKPFACSKCGKGFTQRFNRTVHMRTCKK